MDRTSTARFARAHPTVKEWRVCSSSSRTIAELIAFLRDPLQIEYKVSEPCVIEGSIWGDEELTDGLSFPILAQSFLKIGSLSLNALRDELGTEIPDLIRVTADGGNNYYLLSTQNERIDLAF